MSSKFNDLIAKLREIFQIDKSELDFGIYRIINARAKQINDFLENKLAAKVRGALAVNAAAEKAELESRLNEAVAGARAAGVPEDDSPKVKEIRGKIAALANASADSESLVYAHLLTFFSRYYDNGDFISKRRYKGDVYAVPYAGEEVKLHWANADQYYTKSGENFTNYDFKLPDGARVHFKLVKADTAKDNIKDNDAVRCFVLWNPENVPAAPETDDAEENETEHAVPANEFPADFLEEKDGELFIYFQYLKFPKGTKQATLLKEASEKIAAKLGEKQLLQKFNLLVPARTESEKKRTLLEKELTRYTAKNSSDYFIHKDLKTFLTRELDFYIKNEMLHLDDIQHAEAFRQIENALRQIQTVRTIALELIAFMAQLEDFQKKLWLKKKFVVRADYCITLDRVPAELHEEIFANEAQLDEWEKLGFSQNELFPENESTEACGKFDFRMVDTKFFPPEFKEKLLAEIPELDENCDGLLIRSENFQALNFLRERYREKIKSVFVDPPYNTESNEGENDFLYKDCYRHSSWMSFFRDRVIEARQLLSYKSLFQFTISDEELKNSLFIFDEIFGEKNRMGVIEWNSTKSVTNKALISMGHTHVPIYALNRDFFVKNRTQFRLPDSEEGFSNPDNDPRGKWKADPFQVGGVRPNQLYGIKNPKTGVVYYPNPGNSWKNDDKVFKTLLEDNRIVFGVTGESGPQRKRFWFEAQSRGRVPKTWWDEEETTTNGTAVLKNLFGVCPFKNPKPVGLLKNLQALCASSSSTILDYFAGSGTTGHAVINLNREDGVKRKYILVEMGEHFETVLKPRIEKVVYSPNWKDGKPLDSDKGVSHCFKYLTLESYEDTLNNLQLKAAGDVPALLRDEYLLNYMLDVESRGSLLSTEDFRKPFDYALDIAADSSGATVKTPIDLVETFNYLIGLQVKHIDSRRERGFVKVVGVLPNGEEAMIFWRDCEKIDNAKLNETLATLKVNPNASEFKVYYVNGDHAVENLSVGTDGNEKRKKVLQIEDEFLKKMFEEA